MNCRAQNLSRTCFPSLVDHTVLDSACNPVSLQNISTSYIVKIYLNRDIYTK